GTITQRLQLAANATTVTLSAAPLDPSLLVVIAEQTLVSGTDFTTNANTNTVTLSGSGTVTQAMVVRVGYPVVGGGTRTQNFSLAAGHSRVLQLRNELATGAVTVTTYKTVTGFTVSGSQLTVPSVNAARTLVVNRPAEVSTYLVAEPGHAVGDPVLHTAGE